MSYSVTFPKFKAFDSNGLPLAGGILRAYDAGTSTQIVLYQDHLLETPHELDIILDSAGETVIWTDTPVKLMWYTSAGVYVGEMDWLGYSGETVAATDAEYSAADYGILPNGSDMTAVLLAAMTDIYNAGGGVLKFGQGIYRLDGQWRWRPSVSIRGVGMETPDNGIGVTEFDCRYTGGCSIYADELLRSERYEDFLVTHANNTGLASNIDMIQLRRGISRGKFRIALTGKTAATRHGLRVYGANPDTGVGNNNLYYNDFNITTYASPEVNGTGLYLGEPTSPDKSRANANTIRGRFLGWSTQCYTNGNGNRYLAETNPASVAGWDLYGNGTYANKITPPAYFDGIWTGARVRLNNTDTKVNTMVHFDPVPGLSSTTQITKVATAYPGDARNTNERVYSCGCAAFNPADVSEYWFGAFPHLAPSATADVRRKYILSRGSITKVKANFYNSTSNGTDDSPCTLRVKVNNTTEYTVFYLTIKLSATQEQYTITTLSIPVNVGDYVEFRFITSTWATNPVGTLVDVQFTVE